MPSPLSPPTPSASPHLIQHPCVPLHSLPSPSLKQQPLPSIHHLSLHSTVDASLSPYMSAVADISPLLYTLVLPVSASILCSPLSATSSSPSHSIQPQNWHSESSAALHSYNMFSLSHPYDTTYARPS